MKYSIDQLIGDAITLYDQKYLSSFPDKALWIIRDSMFVLLNGLQRPELKKYIQLKAVTEKSKEKPIPIIGQNLYASNESALLLFGTAMVSDELDEGNQFAKGHPAAHVFPAALVTAIETNSSFKEFIRAFAIGYEVSARLGYASNIPDDMHPHGTWGLIGGAIAVGLLKKISLEKLIKSALIAASFPIVTSWKAAISGMTVRNLYCGLSSLHSYESIDYAECGFESSLEVVEHVWSELISVNFITEKLHKELFSPPLFEKNYFKLYPSCRFTHSSIDALINLLNKHKVDFNEVKQILVETYSLAARLKDSAPKNYLSAKFSIPYILSAILHEVPLQDAFLDKHLSNESIKEFSKKINVKENQVFTALLPEKRASKITIVMSDGKKYVEIVEAAKGEYSLQFPEKELLNKFKIITKNLLPHITHTQLMDIFSIIFSPQEMPVKNWVEECNRRISSESRY